MANRLDGALQECLELVREGASLEDCLARYPEDAQELEPLLRTAVTVESQLGHAMPSTARTRVRNRVLGEWDRKHQPRQRRWALPSLLPRWAAVAASLFVAVMVSGVGTVAAAGNAVPGEPLYRIKEITEEVRLWMERSDQAKLEIYTRFIRERADELKELAETGKSHRSVVTLERLEDQITGANALIDKNRERLANDPSRDASDFSEALSAMSIEARSARSTLMETLEQVPAEAQPALQEALAIIQRGQDRVRAALEATLGER